MQYRIIYKQGTDNRVADALSRRAHDNADLLSISICTPQWSQTVIDGYFMDDEAKGMITKLAVDGASVPNFSLHDGVLKFKGRIWAGQ